MHASHPFVVLLPGSRFVAGTQAMHRDPHSPHVTSSIPPNVSWIVITSMMCVYLFFSCVWSESLSFHVCLSSLIRGDAVISSNGPWQTISAGSVAPRYQYRLGKDLIHCGQGTYSTGEAAFTPLCSSACPIGTYIQKLGVGNSSSVCNSGCPAGYYVSCRVLRCTQSLLFAPH
jgi:hypothetical protein